ncbi:MAG: GNAT family N-acetyltransferase [Chloroflexi bacterium]|nr:GNAT family N-acetyltransferase [Chloroflexota bacterium]
MDQTWVSGVAGPDFGWRFPTRRGELLDVLEMPGIVALDRRVRVGFLSYQVERIGLRLGRIAGDRRRQQGIGTALLNALRIQVTGCRRIWLITTNDNLDALRFYHRLSKHLHLQRQLSTLPAARFIPPRAARLEEGLVMGQYAPSTRNGCASPPDRPRRHIARRSAQADRALVQMKVPRMVRTPRSAMCRALRAGRNIQAPRSSNTSLWPVQFRPIAW